MKRIVLALSAVAAFAAPALAADMAPRYTKAPPPPVAAVVNWTGCYVGGGGGYGMWNQENTGYNDPGFIGPNLAVLTARTRITETVTTGGRGYFGTVQGGCDYQFSAIGHQFVIGAFGDYDFDSLKGNHNPPGTGGWAQEKMSSAWSVGGRIGWLAFPSSIVSPTRPCSPRPICRPSTRKIPRSGCTPSAASWSTASTGVARWSR